MTWAGGTAMSAEPRLQPRVPAEAVSCAVPRLKRVTKKTRPTSRKIAAILESLDITQPQYVAWLGCPVQGHRLTCFFKMNPNLHIRNLYDLLVEHQEIIRAY